MLQQFVAPTRAFAQLGVASESLLVAGTVVGAASLAFAGVAMATFRHAGTNVSHALPTTSLVDDGVFGVSRNPIYVGMVGLLAGVGIATDNVWMLAGAACLASAIHLLVIPAEESFLARRFEAEYSGYCKRVPRWLLLC